MCQQTPGGLCIITSFGGCTSLVIPAGGSGFCHQLLEGIVFYPLHHFMPVLLSFGGTMSHANTSGG